MGFFEQLAALSPLKIAVSAIVMMGVSLLWYSPFLFGKSWMRLSGIRIGDIRARGRRSTYIVTAVISIVSAVLLALVAAHSRGDGSMIFLGVGFIWLFVMLEQLNHMISERQPFALFLMHTARSLAALMAGCAVFYFWS